MKKIFTQTVALLFVSCFAMKSNAQWQLTGNANATATSILGTTNAIPLNLTTNNATRMTITSAGRVGIGTTTPPNIFTVKGKAADEALDDVIAALDRATLAGAPFLRIVHGHGTGKLKASLRDYLKDSPYVAEFRAGDRAEGGDGVTIARLR